MPAKNEELFYAFVIGTGVFLILVVLVLLVVFLHMQRIKRFHIERDFIKAQHDQELLKTQLEIQEQTLTHISQEVHDNIGQTLSVVKVYIGSITTENEAVQSKVGYSFALLTKAIQDLRNLSHHLNTDYIHENGLLNCIVHELEIIRHSGTLKVEIKIQDCSLSLTKEQDIVLFRVMQELLTNVLKHSKATQLEFFAECTPGLCMTLSDNGVGFNPQALEKDKGIGLKNIEKRINLIGGSVTFHSVVDGGTTTTIELPYQLHT